jgi:AcrR family transcriptional regulator
MTTGARYHSPLRAEQAAGTHARIVDACVQLMQDGEELTYAAVATRAGVQERTVYRHFPTKADLESAVWSWLTSNLTHVTFDARTVDDLVTSMRASFQGFDDGAPLIQAMLHSPHGLEVRRRQQPGRRAMFESCVDDALTGAPPAVRRRAAAALQVLYSATAWEQLRVFWGMDASEAAAVVELAIRAMIDGLQAGNEQPTRRGKA